VVKGLRDRHTGERRNPWNEFECGNHYARSLASWALVPALSGFFYSAPRGLLGIAPRVSERDFACFFATGSGWGLVRQKLAAGRSRAAVAVRSGQVTLRELRVAFAASKARVTVAGRRLAASAQSCEGATALRLEAPVTIRQGESLIVEA